MSSNTPFSSNNLLTQETINRHETVLWHDLNFSLKELSIVLMLQVQKNRLSSQDKAREWDNVHGTQTPGLPARCVAFSINWVWQLSKLSALQSLRSWAAQVSSSLLNSGQAAWNQKSQQLPSKLGFPAEAKAKWMLALYSFLGNTYNHFKGELIVTCRSHSSH